MPFSLGRSLIGGLAGGGRGAGIGVLAGAAGGTALAATKKGEQISIPSESLVEFRLEQPASLPSPDEPFPDRIVAGRRSEGVRTDCQVPTD